MPLEELFFLELCLVLAIVDDAALNRMQMDWFPTDLHSDITFWSGSIQYGLKTWLSRRAVCVWSILSHDLDSDSTRNERLSPLKYTDVLNVTSS